MAGIMIIDWQPAAGSICSLSPFGERVGVRGLQNHRKTLTPHPALSLWERERTEIVAPPSTVIGKLR